MHKEEVSRTLFALMAGATVGAGVGLLLAPQTGSQFRSSLRNLTRQATDQADQSTKDRTQSSAMRETAGESGVPELGLEGGGRSAQKDHTIGDTGQDN